jgi:hypothetical protein
MFGYRSVLLLPQGGATSWRIPLPVYFDHSITKQAVGTEIELRIKDILFFLARPGDKIAGERSSKVSSIVMDKANRIN